MASGWEGYVKSYVRTSLETHHFENCGISVTILLKSGKLVNCDGKLNFDLKFFRCIGISLPKTQRWLYKVTL